MMKTVNCCGPCHIEICSKRSLIFILLILLKSGHCSTLEEVYVDLKVKTTLVGVPPYSQ